MISLFIRFYIFPTFNIIKAKLFFTTSTQNRLIIPQPQKAVHKPKTLIIHIILNLPIAKIHQCKPISFPCNHPIPIYYA